MTNPSELTNVDLLITPVFAGALLLLQIVLTLVVGRARQKTDIRLGSGGDTLLERKSRAHGNFTESVPVTLVAMCVCELIGASHLLLWGAGLALFFGRVLHAINLIYLANGATGRDVSMGLTTLSMAALALFALVMGVQHAVFT